MPDGGAERPAHARVAATPFLDTLGAQPDPGGEPRVVLPVTPGEANRNGTVHGGALAALLFAAAEAVAADADGTSRSLFDASVAYVAVARGGPVTATGRVLRRGRAITHVETVARDPDGHALARATTVHRVGGIVAAEAGTPPGIADPPEEPLDGVFGQSPFSQRLGIQIVRRASGRGIAVMRWSPTLADASGAVAVGALATLIDTASGAAAWSVIGFDPRGRAATLAMHVAVHGAARDEDIVGDSSGCPAGPEHAVCLIRLWGRRSRALVATGSATYRITLPQASREEAR